MTPEGVTFEQLPTQAGEHGKPLTAYLVIKDGVAVGTVFQAQRRWSRMSHHGRIRMADFHPVRWGYTTRIDWTNRGWRSYTDSDGFEQDRRWWAVELLLALTAEEEPPS